MTLDLEFDFATGGSRFAAVFETFEEQVCSHEVWIGVSASQQQIGHNASSIDDIPAGGHIAILGFPSMTAKVVRCCCCVPVMVIFLETTSKATTSLPNACSTLLRPSRTVQEN